MAGKVKSSKKILLLPLIIGVLTLLMLPSLAIAIINKEYFMIRTFLLPPAAGLLLAIPAALVIRKKPPNLRIKDGFLLVFLTWVFASLIGSIPYSLSPVALNFSDSVFESSCAFATTGATTISDIESLPYSLLFWRSMSHWTGGIGIILLSVALLPLLGVGGFRLIKAEAPGPGKEKLSPRITGEAKVIFNVYCVFTSILILLYRIGGMEWFDAVCHGFTIMATGGVSTKNTGFAFFNSKFIDWVTTVFMLLGALSFTVYYRIVKGKIKDTLQNTEARVYFFIFFIASALITINLIPHYGSFGNALRFGTFHAASILSTAGNIRTDYTAWPALAQGVLFCLMFIGGCSSSTGGGIKVIRHTVLFKQAGNELRRLLYPQGVFSIQINNKAGRKDVVYGVAAFVFIYFIIVAVTTLLTTTAGFDIFTSFSSALSITGNIGVGFGRVDPSHNYGSFPAYLKLFYSLVMIAGRLEIWTLLVLLSPEYWKR